MLKQINEFLFRGTFETKKKFLIFSHTEQLLGKPLEVETFNGDIKRQNGRGGTRKY